MTAGKKFKRAVRERMQQTGESYTTARMRLEQEATRREEACPSGCPIDPFLDMKTPGGRDVCGTCGRTT